jgi:hypothetical protein
MPQIYSSTASRNPLDFETRRTQANGKSIVVTLPKVFADALEIGRGDLVRFCFHSADKRKVVMEKIALDNDVITTTTTTTTRIVPSNNEGNQVVG